MKRRGSLLIEALVALMVLAIAVVFIGQNLCPLARMADATVIQQDLMDIGASIADKILTGVISSNDSGTTKLNGNRFGWEIDFSSLGFDKVESFANTTINSTTSLWVVHSTITTIDTNPTNTLSFSVFLDS